MKYLFTTIFLAATLVSCKAHKDAATEVAQTPGVGPIQISKERIFTDSEMVIGRRICNALKNKRQLFEGLTTQNEAFRFKGEYKGCSMSFPQNLTEFTANISNATTSDLQYIATSSRPYDYFKDVLTDQNGAMKSICENLSVSNSVSNYSLSGSSYVIVNLLISEGYDRFEVTKLSKDTNNNYKAVSSEGVNILTQTSQTIPKFFGVEKERTLYLPCSNSSQTSYNKQTWIAAVTNF